MASATLDGFTHDLWLHENTSATSGRGIIFYEWRQRRTRREPDPLPVRVPVPVRVENGWTYPGGIPGLASVNSDLIFTTSVVASLSITGFAFYNFALSNSARTGL